MSLGGCCINGYGSPLFAVWENARNVSQNGLKWRTHRFCVNIKEILRISFGGLKKDDL